MKLIQEKIGSIAKLTGYIHETSPEMANIKEFPAILVLPGGGMRICSDREAEPVAMSFYAEGYSAFVLKYTTVSDKPDAVMEEPMQEVQETLRWIRDNAAELAIDPKKVAVIGFSGGGHLACASITHGTEKPDALVLGYPGIVESAHRALNCPDILEHVDETMPPVFLFGSRFDPVTPPVHILSMVQRLTEVGIDYEVHMFNGKVHGLSLGKSFTCSGGRANVDPVFAKWFPMCIDWLKEKLGDFTIYGVNDGRAGKLHTDLPLAELAESPEAFAILKEMIPGVEKSLENQMAKYMTPHQMQQYIPGFSEEKLRELEERLLALR